MLRLFRLLWVLSFVLLISACANPFQTHITTVKTAIRLLQDVSVNKDEVAQSAVPLALIKSGDRPTALIAMAHDEHGKEKWISNDKAMLVIRNGRVVKTLGFENDLLTITGPVDPLLGVATENNSTWISQLDWEAGEYGYLSRSELTVSAEPIVIYEQEFQTTKVTESVVYNIARAGKGDVSQWQNHYWYHKTSGKLLKSSQKSAPFSDRFQITYVSNAVALM